jgi:large subunit ribosomal protein L23
MAKMALAKKEPKKTGPNLAYHQVVVAPMVSEKVTHLVERRNTYGFQVHPQATKHQIKEAVEKLFDVHVVQVRTQVYRGKRRRFKSGYGMTATWKKAYVTLSEKDRITLF